MSGTCWTLEESSSRNVSKDSYGPTVVDKIVTNIFSEP